VYANNIIILLKSTYLEASSTVTQVVLRPLPKLEVQVNTHTPSVQLELDSEHVEGLARQTII
jgi:hypothetical protein